MAQSEKVILEASVRVVAGKQSAGALRRQGFVPGVVYGEKLSAVQVQVAARDLTKVLRTKAGENVLITLCLKDGSGVKSPAEEEKKAAPNKEKKIAESAVLIKELQRHPVSHQIVHVDFHRISLTKRITVTVPLAFKGDAIGVKQGGGILEHIRWDLEVECLPTQIPAEIPVDVSSLELGQSLSVKAVLLPEGVRLITDAELPIVSCVMPKEEVSVPAAAEVPAEAAEPEVLKQKKPEAATPGEESGGKEKEEKKKG